MLRRKDGDILLSIKKQLKCNKKSNATIMCLVGKEEQTHLEVQKIVNTITLFRLYFIT